MTTRVGAIVVAVAVASIALVGCASDSGNSSESITFYTDLDPQEAQPLIDAFTADTGISVELFTGGSASVLARWQSEEASDVHVADVVNFSGAAGYDAVATEGFNTPIPDSVDFLEGDRPDNAFDPDRMWFSTTATVVGIAYNPDNVSQSEAPTGWSDLTDPAWKGELTLPAPTLSTATAAYFQMANDTALGKDFLVALSEQDPVVTQKSGDTVSALVTGDTTIGMANDNAVWAQKRAGAPLEFVYPADGQPVLMNYVMLAKNAPNPDGAAQFLQFLASTEAGALYAETGQFSALSSVPPLGEGRPGLSDLVAWPLDGAELVEAQPEMAPFLQERFGG
jgi:iron(III) transport system substrate-binding protein